MLDQESVGELSPEDARAIDMISNLAPGDFAAVKKRLDILGLQATPELLIKELKSEVAVKYGAQSGTIGFL